MNNEPMSLVSAQNIPNASSGTSAVALSFSAFRTAVTQENSVSSTDDEPRFLHSRPIAPDTVRIAEKPTLVGETSFIVEHDDPTGVKLDDPAGIKIWGQTEAKVNIETVVSIPERVALWENDIMRECQTRNRYHEQLVSYINAPKDDHVASLLLITGDSGAGKTRLAQSLKDPVEAKGGYFLTGKFDQRQHLEPYVAFVSAFTDFTDAVVKKGDKVVEKTRDAIVRATGGDAHVLTGMIPALERILGKPDDLVRKSQFGNASQRFVFVFRKFLRAVCTPKRPIVLLMDDLHWADPCSLDVLASIVMELDHKGLMILGTCDTNVSPDSYLSQKLREIEDVARISITSMSLPNMASLAVQRAIAKILKRDPDDCRELAKIVSIQTDGKPFFIAELLRWLSDSGLFSIETSTAAWGWNEDDIRLTIDTSRPGQFLVDKLEQLPRDMQEVLKVASCLGIHVEKNLIEFAIGHPIDDPLSALLQTGVLRLGSFRHVYPFAHDELQRISYQLISESDRERFHLDVGRKIWRALDQDGVDRYIFVVLSQLAIARRLITGANERLSTAFLCLDAGKKAAKASTFRTAAFYLSLGIELVGDRGWRDEYHLTLALHNASAEMEMCTTNYERVDTLVKAILSHARNQEDEIQAYVTQISMLANSGRQSESLDLGIKVLEKLDERFPPRLSSPRLLSEVIAVRKLLKDKSDEQLLRLPLIDNDRKLACLQVLNQMVLSALFVRPKLYWFLVMKSVKLTLAYGLSNFASTAFAVYGMICVTFGEIDEAYRFGELGIKLLNKFGSMEYLARVYAARYGVIHSWKKPSRDAMAPLWKASQVGAQTGDIEYSSLCARLYLMVSSLSSRNLPAFLKKYDDVHKTMISRRQETFAKMCLGQVQAANHFMGLTEDPLSAKGDIVDFDQVLNSKQVDPSTSFFLYACRMWIAYVFNDFELASRMATNLTDFWAMAPTMGVVEAIFYSGLTAVASARLGCHRRKNISMAEKHLRLFRKWSQSAPFNCGHQKCLVEAELASVQKQNGEALEKYTYAIALANEFGFTLEHAIANERAAQHLVRIGEREAAEHYYNQACVSYEQWGGKAKLVRLKGEVAAIYGSQS